MAPRTVVAPPGHVAQGVAVLVVALAVAAAVAVRLDRLTRPPSVDEAGFLLIGAGWHPGSSLYGDYWVDRPPLLIGLFGWAAHLGGLEPLRVLGCVATGLVVVLTAATAHRLGGPRAAAWTAVVAAAWLASRHLDAQVVDGELLAAPFVAAGVYAVSLAVTLARRLPALVAATVAGAALVAALAVKQNMGDVAVFGTVVLLVATLRRDLRPARAAALLVTAVAGAAATAVAIALWTVSRGTSLPDLWYALYPFRLDARRVLGTDDSSRLLARKSELLDDVLWSGLVLAPVAAVLGVLRTRCEPAVAGLLAVLAYDTVSVLAGDSAWQHYLVQAIVPGSLVLGLLAGRLIGVRAVAVAVVLSAVWTTVHHPEGPDKDPRKALLVGQSVRRSAQPGDELLALYGRPGVNLGAGLHSPYPYFWSLPIKVLDPGLTQLTAELDGSARPAWVVVWDSLHFARHAEPGVEAALRAHYRADGVVYGARVFVRDDLDRPPVRWLGPR